MSGLDALRADRLRAVVAAVAALTVVSGLGQLILPGVVLDALGAESTPTSRHFFAIVGMFMAVVGGVTLQALLVAEPPSYVVLWCALQKAGAVAAVTIGVARDLFGGIALVVAGFDLLSAVLAGMLWYRLHRRAVVPREAVPA